MKRVLFLLVCLITLGLSANAQTFDKGDAFLKATVGYSNSSLNKRVSDYLNTTNDSRKNMWSGSVEVGKFLLDNFAIAAEAERIGTTGIDQMIFNLKAQYYLYNFYGSLGYSAAKLEETSFKHRGLVELRYVYFINKSKSLAIEPAIITYIEPHWKSGGTRFNTDLAFKLGFSIRL